MTLCQAIRPAQADSRSGGGVAVRKPRRSCVISAGRRVVKPDSFQLSADLAAVPVVGPVGDRAGVVDAEDKHATHGDRTPAGRRETERHPVRDGRPLTVDDELLELVPQVGELGEERLEPLAVGNSTDEALPAGGRVFVDEIVGDAGGDAVGIVRIERREVGLDRPFGASIL